MHWRELIGWLVVGWLLIGAILLFVLGRAPIHAQSIIVTEEGTSIGVELIPGVRQFSGAITGSVIEIMPGVRHYDVHRGDNVRSSGTVIEMEPLLGAREVDPSMRLRNDPTLGVDPVYQFRESRRVIR